MAAARLFPEGQFLLGGDCESPLGNPEAQPQILGAMEKKRLGPSQGWRDDQEPGTGLMAKVHLHRTILSRLGRGLRYLTHRNNTRDSRNIKQPMTICSKQKDNLQTQI